MRTSATICLALVFLTAGMSAAQPVSAVKEIQIRNLGAGRVDESFVLAHTSLRPGSEIDRSAVARDVRVLLATGRFSHVGVEIEPLDQGVRLVYSFRNKLKLDEPVVISGVRPFRKEKMRDLLGLAVGDLVDDQVLGVRAQRITERYREKYYPDVSVTWTIDETDHQRGLGKVCVYIDEGQRARLRRVRFAGNEQVSSRILRKAMKWPSRWNPLWWLRKRRHDVQELEVARREILDAYLNRGFLNVAVDMPRVERDKDSRLTVVVNILEGAVYRFGRISFSGISLFPESELKRILKIRTADTASSTEIRTAVKRLKDYYGSRGYINTAVRSLLEPDASTGIVDVHFAVSEGRLVHIRNIRIEGNTRTRDKVIRRELLVYPGDIFNEVKVKRSKRRLSNLGYFSSVRQYPVSTRLPDQKDLVFEVEEKRTGQFMLGAGFSSIDRLMGFVELSQGNFDVVGWPYFVGGGQKLKLRGQFGSSRRHYEFSFVEPWFMNRKLSLGFDLYRTDVGYSDYDVERTGSSLSLGKALPGANRLNLRYQLEKTVLSNIADTNRYVYVDLYEMFPEEEYYFDREETDTVESSLSITLTHDTRDNPFFPKRGNRVSLLGSVSGGVLGFDTDLYELGLRTSHYMSPWFGHVVSLRTRCAVVEEYGDTAEVPISDRLFIGGGRTLRGFEYRDVGPKVRPGDAVEGDDSYRPVGGKSLAMASFGYTIPIVSSVRFALFFDVGNIWRDAYDLDLDRLASSAGAGIRLDVPGFPIRIDRAWVVERDDDLTDEDPWVIWIGYDY